MTVTSATPQKNEESYQVLFDEFDLKQKPNFFMVFCKNEIYLKNHTYPDTRNSVYMALFSEPIEKEMILTLRLCSGRKQDFCDSLSDTILFYFIDKFPLARSIQINVL